MRNYLLLFIIGLTTTLQAQMMLPTYQAVQYKNSGIVLPSVTIGTQIWMTKNLDVTTYRDGTPIPQVTNQIAWSNLTTGAWCYYNNDPANGLIYGKLYNWYAVNDPRGLAPMGWHVPSDPEWTSLTDYLGGEGLAGGKMKATGTSLWLSPNTNATNESSFNGIPGGYRSNTTLHFIGEQGFFWSSSAYNTTYAWYRYLYFNDGIAGKDNCRDTYAFSVRCVKD